MAGKRTDRVLAANRERQIHLHRIPYAERADKARYFATVCGHPVGSPTIQRCWQCYRADRTARYTPGPGTPYHYEYRRDGSKMGEHRIIAENVLGRPLRKNECVHHINMDKRDNRNCNLLICDTSYHAYLHHAMQLRDARSCAPQLEKIA